MIIWTGSVCLSAGGGRQPATARAIYLGKRLLLSQRDYPIGLFYAYAALLSKAAVACIDQTLDITAHYW